MPFGLTNIPATFQAYIYKALAKLLDIFYIIYLDNIFIFNNNAKQHAIYLQLVFK